MNETLKPVKEMTDEELVQEWLKRSGWKPVEEEGWLYFRDKNIPNPTQFSDIIPEYCSSASKLPLTDPAESEKVLDWLAEQGWVQVDWDDTEKTWIVISARKHSAENPNRRRAILEAAVQVKRMEGKE